MKKQEKFDRAAYARKRRREQRWQAWRETALLAAFFVLILTAGGVAQWFMS